MIIDNPRLEHIPALKDLWQQAFGDGEAFLDSFFSTVFSCDRCRCVFSEAEPVAAVYLFDAQWQEQRLCYLYALAVEQSHRGQGLSRLLLADTHSKLQLAGYTGAVLEPASDRLKAYYEKMGYRLFGARQEQTFYAAASALTVSKLGELGYEQAKQALLPPNAVTQNGAMTEYLSMTATLYGGDGFVAAVSKDGAFVPEFVGNRDMIPGFLNAVGLEKATVRLPGDQKHGMYLDFTGKPDLPGYFGLTMD